MFAVVVHNIDTPVTHRGSSVDLADFDRSRFQLSTGGQTIRAVAQRLAQTEVEAVETIRDAHFDWAGAAGFNAAFGDFLHPPPI